MKSAIELFCKNWSAEPSSIGLREEKPKTLKGMSFEGLENLRVRILCVVEMAECSRNRYLGIVGMSLREIENRAWILCVVEMAERLGLGLV
ncbi:hypothetical protein ACFX1X_031889 [Malus domestica]